MVGVKSPCHTQSRKARFRNAVSVLVSVGFGISCALLRHGAMRPIAKFVCFASQCNLIRSSALLADELKSQLLCSLSNVPKTILER